MRNKFLLIVVLGLFLFSACEKENEILMPTEVPSLQKANLPDVAAKRYIVIFNETVSRLPETAAEIAHENATRVDFLYKHSVKGFSAVFTPSAAAGLKNDSRINYCEEDQVVTLGPPSDKPGKPKPNPTPDPQVTPWGISRVGGAGDGTGKTVWVIDTGVDTKHGDLNVNKSKCISFVTRGKYSVEDGNGHGTHVAGTIAALDNNQDVVGVAAGATVIGVRVLDKSGIGSWAWVIAGIDYVAGNASAGDVANMSLGGGASQAVDDAVIAAANKGIKFALAAGNESTHAGTRSPARVNHQNVYTVSAINSSDVFASFSNFGNPPVDYAAPGVYVLSLKKGGGTTTMSGTSMAAPHVAGLLLLGNIGTNGYAISDPDGNADPIAHR